MPEMTDRGDSSANKPRKRHREEDYKAKKKRKRKKRERKDKRRGRRKSYSDSSKSQSDSESIESADMDDVEVEPSFTPLHLTPARSVSSGSTGRPYRPEGAQKEPRYIGKAPRYIGPGVDAQETADIQQREVERARGKYILHLVSLLKITHVCMFTCKNLQALSHQKAPINLASQSTTRQCITLAPHS